MRLFSYALAAQEWGWHEGMQLIECDEPLLDLLLYSYKKRKRQWTLNPNYHTNDNTVILRFQNPRMLIHSTWYFDSVPGPVRRLSSLSVDFGKGNYHTKITYSTDGQGFYYIAIYDWIARCAGLNECVALLDAIDFPAIAANFIARIHQTRLFKHLQSIRCHEDPPRKAYIERVMQSLAHSWWAFDC